MFALNLRQLFTLVLSAAVCLPAWAAGATRSEAQGQVNTAAQKTERWIDDQFINPETKQREERSMFVRHVAGFDGDIGVAITK